MEQEISESILERIFESVDVDGNVKTIKLRFGKPYSISETDQSLKWRCPFQIIGIGSEKIQHGRGIDSVDALLISLKTAEILIASYRTSHKRTITWLNEENLGLTTINVPESDEQTNYQTIDEGSVYKKALDEFFSRRKSNDGDL